MESPVLLGDDGDTLLFHGLLDAVKNLPLIDAVKKMEGVTFFYAPSQREMRFEYKFVEVDVKAALDWARNPVSKTKGESLAEELGHMDGQQLAALQAWTGNVCYPLTSIFRKRKRTLADLQPVLPYAKLLFEGLRSLPERFIYKGTIYRAESGVSTAWAQKMKAGTFIQWFSPLSFSKKQAVLKEFVPKEGDRTLFVLEAACGYDIQELSLIEGEQEVLVECVSRAEVVEAEHYGKDHILVIAGQMARGLHRAKLRMAPGINMLTSRRSLVAEQLQALEEAKLKQEAEQRKREKDEEEAELEVEWSQIEWSREEVEREALEAERWALEEERSRREVGRVRREAQRWALEEERQEVERQALESQRKALEEERSRLKVEREALEAQRRAFEEDRLRHAVEQRAPDYEQHRDSRILATAEDVSNLTYRFVASKSVEEYVRDDMMLVEEIAENVGPFMASLIAEARRLTQDRSDLLERHASLTDQRLFAIVLYLLELQCFDVCTGERNEFATNLNNVLQAWWWHTDLQHVAGYCHFLLAGLECLPTFSGIVWHGVHGEDAVQLAMRNYIRSKLICWRGFSECGRSRRVVEQTYCRRTGVIFRIEVQARARDVTGVLTRDDIVLMLPCTQFIVTRSAFRDDDWDGVWEIHLVEVI